MKTLQPKNILKLLKNRQVSLGFTLSELIIATSLSAVVISVSGWGLMAMVHNQKISTEKDDILYNINRASEFISNEIRNAQYIEDKDSMNLADTDDKAPAHDFALPTGAIPVLALRVPGVPRYIIYYTQPAPSPWLGPNVISRWGPSFNQKGEYDASTLNTPDKWKPEVLIDLVDAKPFTPNCAGDPSTPSISIPNTYSPVQGFYACIGAKLNPTTGIGAGRLAKFNIGVNLDPKDPKNVKIISPTAQLPIAYQAETTAFARVEVATSPSGQPFGLNGSTLHIKGGTSFKFEVIGGDIICGAGGSQIPVTTVLTINGKEQVMESGKAIEQSITEKETTVDIKSIARLDKCFGGYEKIASSTDPSSGSRIKALKKGDPIPNIKPFANQKTIDDYLEKYIKDNKINIDDNQVIYLFELGNTDKPDPNKNENDPYDLQDNVVLATIK